MNAREKFAAMRADLSAALIEREQEIELCLVALIARAHVLLVGLPGTAKSMIADAVTRWLNGSRFQILLTKFTTPEEVFGPVSLAGLKSDHYRRITTGKLPCADVAFVDEIFKASSAILNTLLTILNERKFDNDGDRLACPLQLCVAASNEWPGGGNGEGKELGALFDRFLLRKTVNPIATERGLSRLLWGNPIFGADDPKLGDAVAQAMSPRHFPAPSHSDVPLSTTLDADELDQAQAEARALPWTEKAREALHAILRESKSEGIIPGDRRMRQSVGVAQAYSWLNGHNAVETDDLEILAHVLWDDPTEQPQKLARIVGKIANPEGMRINSLLIEINQIAEEARAASGEKAETRALAYTKASIQLREIHDQKLANMKGLKADAARAEAAAVLKEIRLATMGAM